jgi:hypothetical protein
VFEAPGEQFGQCVGFAGRDEVEVMIGTVDFATHRGEPAEARLDDAGRWHCEQMPVLVRVLDALYDPKRGGVNPDSREREELHAAARWLKGTVRP